MSRPHRCPVCEGEGVKNGKKCAACKDGVVWEPEAVAEGAQGPTDHHDLTYRKE
jgi:DnaJ-class molecular chaperone